MNDKNAAQAAEQDPLSDQFVNAVIRQHGYDSPEAVIARLWQWIGLNGSENGVTLLMYEAHKALSKLRAPVADEPVAWMWRRRQVDKWICVGHWHSIEAAAAVQMEKDGWDVVRLCPALASAPVVEEAVAWEIPNPHLGSELTSHKARADEARRLGLTVHELFRHAAPQTSEAARDDGIEQIAALIGGHTWGGASEEVSRLIARHIRKLKSQSAALSAQPAKKPATPRFAPAPEPRQQRVCRLAETGNAHTDGGAVYE